MALNLIKGNRYYIIHPELDYIMHFYHCVSATKLFLTGVLGFFSLFTESNFETCELLKPSWSESVSRFLDVSLFIEELFIRGLSASKTLETLKAEF